MLHYIKTVTGLKYYRSCKLEYNKEGLEIYARPFEKYKEWDFFIIVFFIFYRTKIAKETLWKYTYNPMPYSYEIYNKEKLKKYRHILVKDDNTLWTQPKLHITLSDGTEETVWFDTEDEAETNAANVIKEWGLKPYYDLTVYRYPQNNEKLS